MFRRYEEIICYSGSEYFQSKHGGVYLGSIKDNEMKILYSIGVTKEAIAAHCPYFEIYNHNTYGHTYIPLHDAYYLEGSSALPQHFLKFLHKWLGRKSKLYRHGQCNNYSAIVAYIAETKKNYNILDVRRPNYKKLNDYTY